MLKKVIKRIENSDYFNKGGFYANTGKFIRQYNFDDDLNIDAYNGLLRVMFKGQLVGHYHNDDDGKNLLYKAIKQKQDEQKQDILNQL